MDAEKIALSTRYLFACEGRTKKAGILSKSFTVPGASHKVSITDLGEDLMTVAFFNLHRLGYIKLALEQQSVLLLFKRTLLTAKRLKIYPEEHSIEGQLMKHIPDAAKQVSLVIDDYFGRDVDWPQKNIVLNAIADAAACDLGTLGENVSTKDNVAFMPALENIETLKNATVKELEEWDAFNANETQLAHTLKKEVGSAINLKTTRQEYSS